jgi:hypothetical protein
MGNCCGVTQPEEQNTGTANQNKAGKNEDEESVASSRDTNSSKK